MPAEGPQRDRVRPDAGTGQTGSAPARLGLHHFAHLRAVAEGMSIAEAAARYLGIEHGHEAGPRHRAVVEQLRALARRRGDPAWRLVGLTIRLRDNAGKPSLDAFIAERGLDGWSEAEVRELYEEAYPADPRAERRQHLRERQTALLRQLQSVAAQPARPEDAITDWFDPRAAVRLRSAGLQCLGDLARRIAAGGRWWHDVPAVGATKARAMESLLAMLLPGSSARSGPAQTPRFARPDGPALPIGGAALPSSPLPSPALAAPSAASRPPAPVRSRMAGAIEGSPGDPAGALPSRPSESRSADTRRLTAARTDAEAIEAWVAAKAGSQATALAYRRECRRLLLWLHRERQRGFGATQVEDCLAYMAFLSHVPDEWISRRRSSPFEAGWAPFRGQLSAASRQQAVIVLGSFFEWLSATGYLVGRSPWLLVNRRSADDRSRDELDTRAFTPAAWSAIHGALAKETPSASLHRIRFVLAFVEATGLRAAELVDARVGALRRHKGRWALQVHGKGARNRVIAVPTQALEALQDYLVARGLPPLGSTPADTPLLASTRDPAAPIGYSALYQSLKSWIARAVQQSDLDLIDRAEALRASPHWLRHTCGTRALERGAPLDVIQQQFGHADPRTTARYSRAQLERVQDLMDAAFRR